MRGRNVLRAGGLVALAVWVVVAVVAVLAPWRLSTVVLGVRLDTAGAVCFGAAGALLVGAALAAGRGRVARAVLTTVGGLCTAGWLYIAGNALHHPQTLHLGLTHFARRPTEAQFGIACLVVSIGCLTANTLRPRVAAR